MNSALISPLDANKILQQNPEMVKLFDATYPPRGAGGAFIPHSIIFDIDAIADPQNIMPHMLPAPHLFAQHMARLGIKNSDTILIYDAHGIHMAAARAWWMMRVFGHDNVRVINGGLPAWIHDELPITDAPITPVPATEIFVTNFRPDLVVNFDEMKKIVATQSATILDARPRDRFLGLSPEPRAGMRAGHMPHAINVPTGSLIDPATGGLKSAPPLPIFDSEFDSENRVVTTCGSGVTACVIALALFETGHKNAAVYDGSWTEWGAEWGREDSDAPVVTD